MDAKIKHLEMIENVIQRMAGNSFQLKGWAVALVGLIGALAAREADRRFFILASIPLLAFWVLDAYYLQLERKYKILYKEVMAKEDNTIDFSMNAGQIHPSNNDKKRIHFFRCLFSKTEAGFYVPIGATAAVLAAMLILH